MTKAPQSFAERLAAAFEHLSAQRRSDIEALLQEQGIEGGLKGGIARLAGMTSVSTLSDMLAGRIRGQRYRGPLAEVLGVSPAWLEGDDSQAPDWALLPLQVYERWLRQLRIAWQAWFVDRRGGPSATTAMGLRLGTVSGGFRLNTQERQELAQRLDLATDDPTLDALSEGAWHRIPFAMQLAIAEELGAQAPEHPDLVAAGHHAAQQAAQEKHLVSQRLHEQSLRHYLPTHLVQVTRLALVSLRQQRSYQGKSTTAVDDALELIWRQHLLRHNREHETPPAGFCEETGRTHWTPIETLLARYHDDDDEGDERYQSLPGI
ncbi:MAG: hypothetical protein EA401_07650 [Planctomycetota bacterium]|nr:MAG: hypothetical protein EA401_07650 [Planctomycetota bacterium]